MEGEQALHVSIRIVAVVIWVFIMLSFIWTHDIHGVLYSEHFHFKVNPHPHFMDVFIFSDIHIQSPTWWFMKTCHFFGFAIFDALFLWLVKNKRLSLVVTIAFAIFTEVLQLYFYRDGRLYDMMIDSFGACLSFFLIKRSK